MFIIRISGGLGNQMFQYALGRAMVLKNNAELVLDTSFYSAQKAGDPVREYSLSHFNVKGRLATPADFEHVGIPYPLDASPFSKLRKKILNIVEARRPIEKRKIVLEPAFAFVPRILGIKGDCYLSGVWQSEKYFQDVTDAIRTDFELKAPLSAQAREMLRMIVVGDAVSIHVRRGDQVSNPYLLKKHGALTDEYYKTAVAYMRERVQSPRFFIFSDEPEWVKENLDIGGDAVIVSGQGIPDYEELTLMSRCKHQIIAKSSYSWWGGWLNRNKDKIVIAPKQRFAMEGANDSDLIPHSWVKL